MSFKPEKTGEFIEIFKTSRHLIAGFEGCSHVELLQDQDDPTLFFTYSLWRDEICVENYRQSEIFEKVWGSTKVLFKARPQAWSVKEII